MPPRTPPRTTSRPARCTSWRTEKEMRYMTDKLKFFSQEWCDAAREAVNANPDVLAGFKDASSFTNKMEFGVIGRDDVASHLEF
ncbi:hypothetical protein ACFQ70_51690, partial [Rhodococcus koreensis]